MSGFIQKWKDFHEGKLSKRHAKAFLEYLNSPDGKKEFQQLLKLVWDSEITSDKTDAVLPSKPEGQKGDDEQKKTNKQLPKFQRNSPWIYSWIRYAAAVVIFLLMLQEWGFLPRYSAVPIANELDSESSWITKSNPKGIKSKILLPDSSRVFLNAGSEIKYPRNFTMNRLVILNGEAFFEVEKRKEMPFTVQAAHVTTTVLGTSFNINTNSLESIEIALATGKIRVKNEQTGKNMQLVPGEGSLVPSGSKPMQKMDIDPKKISLWKEGILYFDKESFQSILKKLENWYDVKISVNGNFPNDQFSGTFQKKAYLSDVLNVLSHAMHFDYELDGKKVSIYPSPS
ncbi:FecR family protein [Cyclobacterium jeungdonense]|uniref:FecR family protein n=1 Tax=Cyclobacterium jeungdonense TaxID=708087 RepID=A0ABT8CF46_9BACT|nr:FecR family protein [Cyclobacterium jeungdonense]MDN3690301.1 FecR family protein [Cyclobacterium jeungdonense]